MKIPENLTLHHLSAQKETAPAHHLSIPKLSIPDLHVSVPAKPDSGRHETISRRARNVRALVRIVNHLPGLGSHVTEVRRFLQDYEKPWKCPRGFSREVLQRENYTMEIVRRDSSRKKRAVRFSDRKAAPVREGAPFQPVVSAQRPVILQLHGGGYYGKFHNVYRRMAVFYSELTNGLDVVSIDYRVAPEHPFPAALEDAVDAYLYLCERYPAVILTGDSAGGGLSLALTMKLRDDGHKLPLKIITMSAWTDLTASGASYDDNFMMDPVFGGSRDSLIYNSPYVGDSDPENPYISPLFGDFSGFPPVLMQVGEMEMVLSDTTAAAEKMRLAGVDVTMHMYEGMFHDFQMGLNTFPESAAAWEEIREFLEGY